MKALVQINGKGLFPTPLGRTQARKYFNGQQGGQRAGPGARPATG
ncbi:hypothetical protein [Streptomyces sp. NPDC050263]